MLKYVKDNNLLNNLILLRITPHIILEKDVFFSDGNAASRTTKFYNNVDKLSELNWDLINEKWYDDSNETKKKKMSEVLVKHHIKRHYIDEIVFNNENHWNTLLKLFPNHLGIKISYDKSIFNIVE
jgi:hypothetical protein